MRFLAAAIRERSCSVATCREANPLADPEISRRCRRTSMSPNGDCPWLGALWPRTRPVGEGSSTYAAARASTSPLQHALHLPGTPVACPGTPVGCRVACDCTWASIGCGRGASVAGPGWIQRISGVDVRGRVQSLASRSITSQAMTAGELPLSKARPTESGCKDSGAGRPRMETASGSKGDGRAWRRTGRTGPRALRRALAFGIREYAVAGVRQIASYRSRGAGSSMGGRRDAARADNGSTDDEPASSKARSVNAAHRRRRPERCAGSAGALASSATTR